MKWLNLSMFAGYWIVPWKIASKLPIRPKEAMSILSFLKAASRKDRIPGELLVVGLDRLFIYTADIEVVAGFVRDTLSSAPTFLWRNTVVIMPVEEVNLNEEWKIELREGSKGTVPVRKLFPRAEIQVVVDITLCYSPIIFG